MLKIIEAKVRRKDLRERATKTRIYCFPEKFNVIQDLMDRSLGGSGTRFTKEALKPMVVEFLKSKDIHYNKLTWSRKAGCSCGCSPGFIMDGFNNHDIFITYTENEND